MAIFLNRVVATLNDEWVSNRSSVDELSLDQAYKWMMALHPATIPAMRELGFYNFPDREGRQWPLRELEDNYSGVSLSIHYIG
jgi:hypothetical protein